MRHNLPHKFTNLFILPETDIDAGNTNTIQINGNPINSKYNSITTAVIQVVKHQKHSNNLAQKLSGDNTAVKLAFDEDGRYV
jgi:hypothetical protein